MRVFRQAALGEWDDVISQVRAELELLTLQRLLSKNQSDLIDALAFHQRGQLIEAEQIYRNILIGAPDQFDARHLLGVVMHQQGRNAEALEMIGAALQTEPNEVVALSNYGAVLNKLKRFDEALASYDKALALKPDYAEAHFNRGDTLKELKRFDEALASYDRALSVQPDYAEAHFNEALCRLLVGEFDRGWEKHEWRWGTKQLGNIKRSFTQPLWLGPENISGKTILLHAEQGYGDTIQFCHYVSLGAEGGPRANSEASNSPPTL